MTRDVLIGPLLATAAGAIRIVGKKAVITGADSGIGWAAAIVAAGRRPTAPVLVVFILNTPARRRPPRRSPKERRARDTE
jgi:NAD(P)-dependent dehydrogenase (short-subunit alcohol dehydrogenase family)